MGNLLKKSELLNQNPSISNVISVLQEAIVELDKLMPKEEIIEEIEKVEDDDKPKRKKKNA